LYWPWIIYRDTYNGLDVTIPPSCGIVTAFARSDNLSFPWFAPAGLLRGIIPGAIGLAMVPTLAEKDALYGNGNAVNPIVKYVGNDNYMIWGQKTLQRTPTALDRVNVRRMLFYVEKQLRSQARGLLFEPHTAELRQKFTNIASSILQTVKANSGVYDYTIKCDEELNTANVIDRNEMRAQIGLQPTRATEFIFIEFSLHRTGSFTESTSVLR
jgi:phage tail sheath protein FI